MKIIGITSEDIEKGRKVIERNMSYIYFSNIESYIILMKKIEEVYKDQIITDKNIIL